MWKPELNTRHHYGTCFRRPNFEGRIPKKHSFWGPWKIVKHCGSWLINTINRLFFSAHEAISQNKAHEAISQNKDSLFPLREMFNQSLESDVLRPPKLKNQGGNWCWLNASSQMLLTLISLGQTPLDPINNELEYQSLSVHEKAFLKALNSFKEAVDTGHEDSINRMERSLFQKFTQIGSADFRENPDSQHDPLDVFLTMLPLLGCNINIKHPGNNPVPTPVLQISFPEIGLNDRNITLQGLVNRYFSRETRRLGNREGYLIENGPSGPPDIICLQLKRFYAGPEKGGRTEVVMEKWNEDVTNRAAQIGERNPSLSQTEAWNLARRQLPPPKFVSRKDNRKVLLSETNQIDFSHAFEDQENPLNYELVGVLNHEGSLNSGHYTANVARQNEGIQKWYNCNGRSIREISPQRVNEQGSSGYIFLFKKV